MNYEQATGEETAVEKVTNIGGVRIPVVESGDGLYVDDTRAGRYVYRGSNPNNYITFSGEIWRIISVEKDGTIKIIRNEDIGKIPFDSKGFRDSTSNGAGGTYCAYSSKGCNAWAINSNFDTGNYNGTVLKDSELSIYLNNEYYSTLNYEIKNNIQNYNWKIGYVEWWNNDLSTQITNENMITWNGKVGLISTSDYLNANSNIAQCGTFALTNDNVSICTTTNWLSTNYWYWTISPRKNALDDVLIIKEYIIQGFHPDDDAVFVRPAVYINSGISLSGDGTQSNPYTIS